MPIDRITCEDDARLAIYRALPKSQLAKQGGFFITEGDLVTQRLLQSKYETVSILLEEPYLEKYTALATDNTPLFVVSHELMLKTVGFEFHRGVVGCGLRPHGLRYEKIVTASPTPCLLAVLPETQDPTNLGAMLRTCAAFDLQGVILGHACADVFSRRTIRVSMGAVFNIPLGFMRNSETDMLALQHEHDIQLCAAVLDSTAENLMHAPVNARTGLVFGSEGHGLPPELINLCQRRITLPMTNRVNSLNASVATGIFVYEFFRRWNSS
jgi:tRNA G18 (ribose-2'-O)-methylase SpoU